MRVALLSVLWALVTATLADDCPRDCVCSESHIARCSHLDLDMFFPERITHLTVQDVPNLKLNLTKDFFKTIGLEKIRSIKITNCTITEMDKDAFKGLNDLMDVDLSDNKLILIHPDTFESNIQLEHLSLSGNPLQLTQVLKAEENYFLKSTSLSELDLSRCDLNDVGKKLLSQLPDLEYISLRANNLKVIDDYIFEKTPLLDEVDLSDNKLISLNEGIFEDIEELTTLNLRNNSIENIDDLELPDLKQLDVSFNNLKLLRKSAFGGISDLWSLNISHNGISYISEESFNELTELRHLDLSENALIGPLPKFIFEENEFLETLSLSGNKEMKIFEGFSTELPKLYKLDISACGLSNITNSSFSGMLSLAILNISSNALTTLNHNVMSKLHRLNDLDASYNEITKVGTYTFASNTHLKKLNLAYNKIHHLAPNTFETTPDLSLLDISHNQFSYLWHANDSEYMKLNGFLANLQSLNIGGNRIKDLHKHSMSHLVNLKEINILDNPLECTAEFPAFVEWLLTHHIEPMDRMGRTLLEERQLEKSHLEWNELLMDICKQPVEPRIEMQEEEVDNAESEKIKQDLNFYQYTVIEDVKLEPTNSDMVKQRDTEIVEEQIEEYVWPTFMIVFSIVFLTLVIGNTVALLIYRSRTNSIAGLKTTFASPFRRTLVKIDNTPRYHKLYEECSVPNTPIVKGNLIGNLVNSQIGAVLSKPKNDEVV